MRIFNQMPIEVDTSAAPAALRWSIRGTWPGIDEMGEARARLMASGQLTPQTRAVFDVRYVETIPAYHEVAAMIAAAMKAGGLPLQRAYLVGSAVQFGLVSQMKALAPAGITVEIFFSEAEAIAWLHQRA